MSDDANDKPGKPAPFWQGRALASVGLATLCAGFLSATGHHDPRFLLLFPSLIGVFVFQFSGRLAARGFLPTRMARPDVSAVHIGLGASVARGAIVEPGAIVEMGADIGEGAIIRSGAVVRMGATVSAGAVVEAGAVVSWGADVKRGAVVGKGARVGAGATIGKHAVVPAGTWVMPGADWKMGDAREEAAPIVATPKIATPKIAVPTNSAPIDPRQEKLDAVFARIDRELAASPERLREHLQVSASGVTSLRATCKSLLERERSLRAEADPSAIARLDAERAELSKKIAAADDEVVKLSLASAVAAIDEQKRQRLLLARNADRLDAEATRLFWTLDALAAQLVRMRSAGAENASSPDAELTQSVEKLQTEIVAIAEALEQVTQDDRAAPLSQQHAVAPESSGSGEREKATTTAEAQRTLRAR